MPHSPFFKVINLLQALPWFVLLRNYLSNTEKYIYIHSDQNGYVGYSKTNKNLTTNICVSELATLTVALQRAATGTQHSALHRWMLHILYTKSENMRTNKQTNKQTNK